MKSKNAMKISTKQKLISMKLLEKVQTGGEQKIRLPDVVRQIAESMAAGSPDLHQDRVPAPEEI